MTMGIQEAHVATRGALPSLGVMRTSRGGAGAELVCQLAPQAESILIQLPDPCARCTPLSLLSLRMMTIEYVMH